MIDRNPLSWEACGESLELTFTYDVVWTDSDIRWASRPSGKKDLGFRGRGLRA